MHYKLDRTKLTGQKAGGERKNHLTVRYHHRFPTTPFDWRVNGKSGVARKGAKEGRVSPGGPATKKREVVKGGQRKGNRQKQEGKFFGESD